MCTRVGTLPSFVTGQKAIAFALGIVALCQASQGQQWILRDVPQEDSGQWDFTCVASSADGRLLAAAAASLGNAPICTSTNYGYLWQVTSAPMGNWYWIASSSNGLTLAALASANGTGVGSVYISTNGGNSWNATWSPTPPVNKLAMSADGTQMVAIKANSGYDSNLFAVYRSIDGGNTWAPLPGGSQGVTNQPTAVACSADGTHIVVTGRTYQTANYYIYVSSDSGITWQIGNAPNLSWNSLASSYDGTKLVVTAAFPSALYTSTDAGTTWQDQTGAPAAAQWDAVASSADGTRLAAADEAAGGLIYTSVDSGASWQDTNGSPTLFNGKGVGWFSVASSADGQRLVAAPEAVSGLYTLDPAPAAAGHVYCACNSNAIPGATVLLGTNVLICDSNGFYIRSNIQADVYMTTVSADGYATLQTNVIVDGPQPITTNDFYLTNSASLIINVILDSSITSMPEAAAISNTINTAAQAYSNYIADPLCVKILFYPITDPKALGTSITERGPLDYSTYLTDLQGESNLSSIDLAAMSTLNAPPNTGILTNTTVQLTPPLCEAIGEHDMAVALRALSSGLDSKIGINFAMLNITRPGPPTLPDLQSTVQHEIDEVFGIGGNGSFLQTNEALSSVGPLDLYRYTSLGIRSFSLPSNSAPYFSIDGGGTPLVYFNQFGDGSDYGDWGDGVVPADGRGNRPPQVQDAFGTDGTAPNLGSNELMALDIVGYTMLGSSSIQSLDLTSNTFTFYILTVPGQKYLIQTATSLKRPPFWQTLGTTFTATGMSARITDTNATGTQKFYRVVSTPSTNPSPPVPNIAKAAVLGAGKLKNSVESVHYYRLASP